MCSKTFALRGTLAHATSPSTIEVLRDALVVVTDGVITNIVQGADADVLQSTLHDVTQLAEDSILLPGFVDTHVHPAQVTFAGSGTDRPLLGPTGWLECYTYPAERAWADPTDARPPFTLAQSTSRALSSSSTRALSKACAPSSARCAWTAARRPTMSSPPRRR